MFPFNLTVVLLISCFFFLSGQEVLFAQFNPIKLENPSFESKPGPGTLDPEPAPPIKGWNNCGPKGETPPDIQPCGVYQQDALYAFDGNTYIGMVVRDNNTWESVGQQLERPLLEGKKHALSIHLARSETYLSWSWIRNQPEQYTTPVSLRIWGGHSYCDKRELLGESVPVENYDWQKYTFEFTPGDDWQFIMIEAYYTDPEEPYNGNVMVDHCSPISIFDPAYQKQQMLQLSDKEIESLIIGHFNTDETVAGNLPQIKMHIVYESKKFEAYVNKTGLKYYVVNSSKEDFAKTVKCLEEIGLSESIDIVRNMGRIYFSDTSQRAPTDMEYFEKGDQWYTEKSTNDKLDEKRIAYISRHKEAIIDELLME